jgi:hypothetical protein
MFNYADNKLHKIYELIYYNSFDRLANGRAELKGLGIALKQATKCNSAFRLKMQMMLLHEM